MSLFFSAYELYAGLTRAGDDAPNSENSQKDKKSAKDKLQRGDESQKDDDSWNSDSLNDGDTSDMAKRFKETFSREDVKIHFLGAWCVAIHFWIHESLIRAATGIPSLPLV